MMLKETQIWHLPQPGSWGVGGVGKAKGEAMVLTSTLVNDKAAPPVFAQKPDESVSPNMSWEHFELLFLC